MCFNNSPYIRAVASYRNVKSVGVRGIKIVFLGTSAGVPCAERKYSCTMLQIGDSCYFVDMGMIVEHKIVERNIDVKAIKGVFITHMHCDHTSGLPSFIYLSDCYFNAHSLNVFLPHEQAVSTLKNWIDCNRIDNTDCSELKIGLNAYSEGEIFNDGVVTVKATLNRHVPNSYSLLVKAEGKNIIFTGDISNPKRDFPVEFLNEKIDLLVCESAHFSPNEYMHIFESFNIEKICFNHYSASRVIELNELKQKLGNIEITTDEFEIEI